MNTLYILKRTETNLLIASIYVDGILVTDNNEDEEEKFKNGMNATFDTNDLGKLSYILCRYGGTTNNWRYFYTSKEVCTRVTS